MTASCRIGSTPSLTRYWIGSSIEIPAARTASGCEAISDARETTISACAAEYSS